MLNRVNEKVPKENLRTWLRLASIYCRIIRKIESGDWKISTLSGMDLPNITLSEARGNIVNPFYNMSLNTLCVIEFSYFFGMKKIFREINSHPKKV